MTREVRSTIMQIEPAGCDGRCPTEKKHIAEEKIDGHRRLFHLGRGLDRPYLTSRRISSKTGEYRESGLNVPHILNIGDSFIKEHNYKYTVLDGELIVPGYTREDLQTVTGSTPDVAIQWQNENSFAVLRVFDILFFNGWDIRNMIWSMRRERLEMVYGLLWTFPEHIALVKTYLGKTHSALFESIVEAGGEGLVLKDPESPYGKGWTKWKKEETYDVVIMGFTKGKNKYRNLFGAVEFGAYTDGKLRRIGRCSGMNDGVCDWRDEDGKAVVPKADGAGLVPIVGVEQEMGTRAWFHQNKESLLGTVIEVKCNGVTRKGSLTHPRFIRVRPDKSPQQCIAPKIGA